MVETGVAGRRHMKGLHMLPSQRALFDIPRGVAFLNAASWSPLPIATQEAGRTGVARKGWPWLIDRAFAHEQHERGRAAAACLIGAEAGDVALIPSVAYGVATAAKGLVLPTSSRVLVPQDDHSSPTLEWMTRAAAGKFEVEAVQRPVDGDWTRAVIDTIQRRGAAPVAFASLPSVHWSDGGMLDLTRIRAALGGHGAGLLVDATQSAGVLDLEVATLDPDFVVFPTYKWLLGPYGRAFLYIAKRHQDTVPLEQTSHGRQSVRADAVTYLADTRYLTDARRFDMGERDHFVSLEMATVGMEMMVAWGGAAVAERIGALCARLAAGLAGAELGIDVPDARVRAPNILSLAFPSGLPERLVECLAREEVYVAPRLGRLRISPHVYNDEEDIDRCVAALQRLLGKTG
jgi:selenocysteine lyase/cysteine desulfurase